MRESFILFCLFILAFDLCRLWRRTFCPVFPSAVRAVAARCKLPFALRPGLSREDLGTKEMTKEIVAGPPPSPPSFLRKP